MGEGHHIIGEDTSFRVADDGLNGLRLLGDFGLAPQRGELATNFAGKVIQPREISLHGFEFAHRFLFATAVLENSRGFFDEASAVFGARVQNLIELTLAHDDMHLSTESAVTQELLNVEKPAGFLVDRILAPPITKQGPGDGDLGVINGQGAIRVVNREDDFSATEGGFVRGSREDDVLHGPTAQRLGALLTHDPGESVHHIGFPGTIGPHHTGDTGFEFEGGGLSEGLESLEGEGFQMHLPTNLPGQTETSAFFAPSNLPVSGGPLAGGTPMGGAVHERFAADDSPTPITGCSLPPVGVQGVCEVAGLTIHVHILAIETCAALRQSFLQHCSYFAQQFSNSGRRESLGGSEVVQLRSPQRLVSIDVADATDQVLIQ